MQQKQRDAKARLNPPSTMGTDHFSVLSTSKGTRATVQETTQT